MTHTLDQLLRFVEENDIKFIRLAFCDMFGVQKNIAIMSSQLRHAAEQGVSFDASAIPGFANVAESDLFLQPDLDPFALLPQIRNAGSVFLGRSAPEALGDYFAGPNHTLPTSGTARFSSPLGVDDFRKRSSFLYYTREALAEAAPRIADFARREGLEAHARSALSRRQTNEKGETNP